MRANGFVSTQSKYQQRKQVRRRALLLIAIALLMNGCQPSDPALTSLSRPAPKQMAVPPKKEDPAIKIEPGEPVKVEPPAKPNPIPEPPKPPPELKFGIDDMAAVAFEDLMPGPGDWDFNDFVTNFSITERINGEKQVEKITIEFFPRAVGGSYDHKFLLVVNGHKSQPSNIGLLTKPLFEGGADALLSRLDADGRVIGVESPRLDQDIVIFPSTHAALGAPGSNAVINTCPTTSTLASPTCRSLGPQPFLPAQQSVRLEIVLKEPGKNPLNGRTKVDTSKYRMVLHVKETRKDIDIIDVDPKNFDANHYPYGFIIPQSWKWPLEGINIGVAYPLFENYRQYLNERASNPQARVPPEVEKWFLSPRLGSPSPLYSAP